METIDIYVEPHCSFSEFIAEVENFLDLSFERNYDPKYNVTTYNFANELCEMWTFERDFDGEEGDDAPYDHFPYVIAIHVFQRKEYDPIKDWMIMKDYITNFGYQVFDTLKQTGKYRLKLTWDSQRLLATFEPDGEANSTATTS